MGEYVECDRDQLPSNFPKQEDEKIWSTGGGGQIKVKYKADIEGYGANADDMARMEALGLPTGFTCASPKNDNSPNLVQKKQKRTYWCDTCMLELNSEDTMMTHMRGAPHMKRQLALEANQNKSKTPSIRPIENPIVTRKKIPIRLHQKISDSPHPVIGLQHIKEFIACSNSCMEPHYECDLCGQQGQANCMLQHLIGARHRQAVVSELTHDEPDKMSLSQAELLKFAEENNEKDDNVARKIDTRYSDDDYPWPAGMEPWRIENGGTGVVPDRARQNFGKNRPERTPRSSLAADSKSRDFFSNIGNSTYVPSKISDINPPKSKEEALKMIDCGRNLILSALKFTGVRNEDRNLIRLTTNVIEAAVLRGLGPGGRGRSPGGSSDRKRDRSDSRGNLQQEED